MIEGVAKILGYARTFLDLAKCSIVTQLKKIASDGSKRSGLSRRLREGINSSLRGCSG